MKLLEKLLDYVSYETTSDEDSSTCPSSAIQLELGKHLVDELKKYGADEAFIDEHGYVYGLMKGDSDYSSIGLIAHMDTSPDASGKNVKTRIIDNYDGTTIKLENGLETSVDIYPTLKNYIGKSIVVTDGNTLLGADDKAGVAIIMEVLDYLNTNKDVKHGDIRVCVTPDEEIGRGADLFNYDYFKVDYCYTVDGSDYFNIAYENFNAASAEVKFTGVSVHPGSAKDKMVNSMNVAHDYHELLDPNARPEHTEGYQGFMHLVGMEGKCEESHLYYIIRSFDLEELDKFKKDMTNAQDFINKKYGFDTCKVTIKDAYRNMKEAFINDMSPIDLFFSSCEDLGIKYGTEAIRGGTDGARLSLEGLPCPNLGTGGDYFHGPHELWCKDDGEKVVEIILKMISKLKK